MNTAKKNPIPLVDFAFKHQAPVDAVVNFFLNLVITWFTLKGFASVPVISPAGSEFDMSLIDTLVPPAVVIAFVISIVTTKITMKKRIAGKVLPPLKEGTPWLANALKWGVIRMVINVLVVFGIGGILMQFAPDLQVPRLAASLIVGVVAGVLSYLQSATAVLRTPEARSPIALPFTP